MLKLKYIRKNSILKYKERYEKLLVKKEIEDCIIEAKKEFNWGWIRIHSIVIGSNYTIGLLEDYSKEMKIGDKILYGIVITIKNAIWYRFIYCKGELRFEKDISIFYDVIC